LYYRAFQQRNPVLKEWMVYETILGTTIQLFYDEFSRRWNIATKQDMGEIYLPRIIHQLNKHLNSESTIDLNVLLQDWDPSFTYQFVLTNSDELYLIAVLMKTTDLDCNDCVRSENFSFLTNIARPKRIQIEKEEHIFDYYGSSFSASNVPGVTVLSNTGDMTCIRNHNYYRRRECKELSKSDFFEYLCFYRIEQLPVWFQLHSTQGDAHNAETYEKQLKQFIRGICFAHLQFYTLKENIHSIAPIFFRHIDHVDSCDMDVVRAYFLSLSPIEIVDSLYYE